jgi:hypothetical protein
LNSEFFKPDEDENVADETKAIEHLRTTVLENRVVPWNAPVALNRFDIKGFGEIKRFAETPTQLEPENLNVILKLCVAEKYKVRVMTDDILKCVETAKYFVI